MTVTYKLGLVDLDAFAPFKVSNFSTSYTLCLYYKILIKIEDKNQDFLIV